MQQGPVFIPGHSRLGIADNDGLEDDVVPLGHGDVFQGDLERRLEGHALRVGGLGLDGKDGDRGGGRGLAGNVSGLADVLPAGLGEGVGDFEGRPILHVVHVDAGGCISPQVLAIVCPLQLRLRTSCGVINAVLNMFAITHSHE